MMKKIYLSSDHAGFELKEKVKKFLQSKNIVFADLNPSFIKNDDYPDNAKLLVKNMKKEDNSKGILICGSGVGMSMAANRHKGIRAVLANDKYSAIMARKDEDSNVLVLRGRKFPFRKTKKIILAWLSTEFTGEKRHMRRMKKLDTK